MDTAPTPTVTPPSAAAAQTHHRPPLSAALGTTGPFLLTILVVAVALVLVLLVPNFATSLNVRNILVQASFSGIVACGMTLLIAAGLFDLSVAGIMSLAAIALAKTLPTTTVEVGIVAALAVGALLGLLNGLVVTKLRMQPFIATLGMLNLYLAAAFIWTDSTAVPVQSVYFLDAVNASVGFVPVMFLVFAVVCGLTALVLHRSYLGRRIRAVGTNETAASWAGIRVDRTKLAAFVITGLFSGIAAVGLSGLLSSASATMATGYELNVIAIVVVGGTALRGGNGTLLGTFTAALLFAMLSNALNLLHVDSYWQYLVTGLVLVAALALNSLRRGPAVRGVS